MYFTSHLVGIKVLTVLASFSIVSISARTDERINVDVNTRAFAATGELAQATHGAVKYLAGMVMNAADIL